MEESNLPGSGLSDWQLKLSYFYVSNKLLFRRLWLAFLILLNCGLWIYVVASLLIWSLNYNQTESQMRQLAFSAADFLPTVEAVKPQNLSFSDITAFASSEGRFDLTAEAKNPNADWLAEFNYAFVADGVTPKYFSAFVLPGQSKVLLDLGREGSNVRLEAKNLKWRRISDYQKLRSERDLLSVASYEFIPPSKTGNPSQLKLTLNNDSAFGFWEADVVAFLYSGGTPVGVNYLSLLQFKAGSQRDLTLNWLQNFPAIDAVEIIPEVNYLDENNIMPPSEF